MRSEVSKIAITLFRTFLFCLLFLNAAQAQEIKVGAERFDQYIGLLRNKHIAVVANQTSVVGKSHLVDTLLSMNIDIVKVFAPEHGFRGKADAGEHFKDQKDAKTGLPILSLYGSKKKPTSSELANVDVVLFDIQDVGVRYYTYISTMHYMLEACAENDIDFIVLDRPNPHGFYVDGPVLDLKYQSFVGMHQIPLVHGLTVGELANMIVGEGWLKNEVTCNLTVITCEHYTHSMHYNIPIAPSPNLPNQRAVYLYPSLGLFEGTEISVGRGTDFPFQVIGNPDLKVGDYTFTPQPNEGASYPPFKGIKCNGLDLREKPVGVPEDTHSIYLNWLKVTYDNYEGDTPFFKKNNFFNLLAGTDQLRKQIEEGATIQAIRESWKPQLEAYKKMRKRYLLYPDFEE
tara:strand:- start:1476 stop:2678 length:1203 start_codon:yes stop_codon:yes gene_type:complete